ncbi:MAG: 50S ribosomal protein L22 [Candidatus Lindowbacteria bacterium RIFCSPLOWO2_12_FULL_62_27]|nr:ribosomal protein L22 [uncultured bacterium]OGH56635.1 MAG: 50S ribosomal protein L22 [Candidatus Lindowbacteria bacterium RIFCSPLOWO2_02_FULL_62_12]OGH59714.1 MAG: 50S ribosomal protein L22 [Candidatus Lindowbacteria bacterium RIFCSPLOWO2_12_FULL_62_27]
MLSVARARFLRITPRKLRVVADLVRGRTVAQAIVILDHTPKHGSAVLKKILKSAQTSAQIKDPAAKPEELRIATLTVDGGPVLKRWMPRAHGRATPIIKRTAHAVVELEKESAPEPKARIAK